MQPKPLLKANLTRHKGLMPHLSSSAVRSVLKQHLALQKHAQMQAEPLPLIGDLPQPSKAVLVINSPPDSKGLICTGLVAAAAPCAASDGRIQFDFLAHICSSFLESLLTGGFLSSAGSVHAVYVWLCWLGELNRRPHRYRSHGCANPRSVGWKGLGICGMNIWECASDPQTTWVGG